MSENPNTGDFTPYEKWWYDEGSGMRPTIDEDYEEFSHRMTKIAWSNATYKSTASIAKLRNEIACRLAHGAESGGHLEYVNDQLNAIFES